MASAPAEVIPTQLAGAEDEFMVDDADRTVNKADAARLRQVKREVTQETLIQKIHDKGVHQLEHAYTLLLNILAVTMISLVLGRATAIERPRDASCLSPRNI